MALDNYNHDPKHFREINKLRERQVKTCPICGNGFDGLKVQVFCSDRCRFKHHAKRRAVLARIKKHEADYRDMP